MAFLIPEGLTASKCRGGASMLLYKGLGLIAPEEEEIFESKKLPLGGGGSVTKSPFSTAEVSFTSICSFVTRNCNT